MTSRSDPSDIETLLQLLNALDSLSGASVIENSTVQATEAVNPDAELERWRAASIEGAVDAETRFAIHVVRGMMKAKRP
jgi:hypothetical protein